MATARSVSPRLEIVVGVDKGSTEQEWKRFYSKFEQDALRDTQRREQKVATAEAVAAVKLRAQREAAELRSAKSLEQIKAQARAKIQASEQQHLQKIRFMYEAEAKKQEILEARKQARIAAGHTTWSQKMLTQTKTLATGMRVLYASAAVGMIKSALDFTASLSDQADAMGVTINQFLAMRSAATAASVPTDRLVAVFVRLTALASAPTDKQKTALAKLGITDEGLTTMQLFDVLLQKIASRQLTLADAIELIGNRQANALMLFATSATSASDAMDKFGRDIDENLIRRADEASDRLGILKENLLIFGTIALDTLFTHPVSRAFAEANRYKAELDAMIADAQAGIAEKRAVGPMQGPPITSEQRAALEAAAANREFADAVIEEWKAEVKRNNELERGRKILNAYLAAQGRATGQIAGLVRVRTETGFRDEIPFSRREFNLPSIGATPQPTRAIVEKGEEKGPLDDVAALVLARREAEAYTRALREMRDSGALTAEQLSAVNQLLGEQAKQSVTVSQVIGMAYSQFNTIFSSIMELSAVHSQNELQSYTDLMQAENDRWEERSSNMRDAGLESSTFYRNEARAFEANQKKMEKQQKELQAKAWEKERDGRRIGVVMASAEAFVNAFTLKNPILIGAMSALIAATTAIQLSTINAQRNPYRGFATGGVVPGFGLMDSQIARVRPGETILTPDESRRNERTIDRIRQGRDVSGDTQNITINITGPILGTQSFVDRELLPRIRLAIRNGY